MFENMTPESIKAAIKAALPFELDTAEGSYTDDLMGPLALELWKAYQTLDAIVPMVYVDETSGAFIDKRCAYYGITRKEGARAAALLTVTGADGANVPKGTVFLTDDGLEFAAARAATLEGETAELPVEAAATGAGYNVPAGKITRQLSSIAGVTAVRNREAAAGGSDPESDAALVARLYARLRRPATSGNASHYEGWALEVEGVGAAKILPLENGPGTVGVLIVGHDKRPVDQSVVARCAAHIEAERPIGASVTVESAAALPIHVAADVSIDGTATAAAVAEAFGRRLADYLDEIAFRQYTLPYSRVAYLLAGVDGVLDYSGLTVNGGTANIAVGPKQVPTAGTVSIT